MAVRTSTLAWVMLLVLVTGTTVFVLRRPSRTASEVAADGLARTLLGLATQTGDAADIYLTSEQEGLLKSLCAILDENAAPAPVAAAQCPPCGGADDGEGGNDAAMDGDPSLVEECPACARCPVPVLPAFSLAIPFLHWNPRMVDTVGVIFVLEANAPPVDGEDARSVELLSQQLLRSVSSLRQTSPGLTYMLATDQVELSTELTEAFPRVITLDEPVPLTGMQKIKALLNSPFQRTLLVDPGVVFCHEMSGVFQFVDNYDLAAPYVRDDLYYQGLRTQQAHFQFLLLRESHASALSSALLVAKRSLRTERLLQEWLVSMTRTTARSDDFWLGRLLPKSDVRFVGLPIEYGLMIHTRSRLPISLMGSVVAFHVDNATRSAKMTCELVNLATEPRVFFPDRFDMSTITALSQTYEAIENLQGPDTLAAETRRKDSDILPVDARMRAGYKTGDATLAPLSGKKTELSRELDEILDEQRG